MWFFSNKCQKRTFFRVARMGHHRHVPDSYCDLPLRCKGFLLLLPVFKNVILFDIKGNVWTRRSAVQVQAVLLWGQRSDRLRRIRHWISCVQQQPLSFLVTLEELGCLWRALWRWFQGGLQEAASFKDFTFFLIYLFCVFLNIRSNAHARARTESLEKMVVWGLRPTAKTATPAYVGPGVNGVNFPCATWLAEGVRKYGRGSALLHRIQVQNLFIYIVYRFVL